MNSYCVSSTLGISLPTLKARHVVMKEPKKIVGGNDDDEPTPVQIFRHRDSFQTTMMACAKQQHDYDDDTLSTVSDDSSFSSITTSCSVSFAEPLVTEINTRPYTTRDEKRVLFYSEREYNEFKMDYFCGRNRLVSFAESVVSNVWTIPPVVDASKVFYSEKELQQFLDEFVASLETGVAMD